MQAPRARSEPPVPGLADAPWGSVNPPGFARAPPCFPGKSARSLTRSLWMPEAQRLSAEGQDASIPSGTRSAIRLRSGRLNRGFFLRREQGTGHRYRGPLVGRTRPRRRVPRLLGGRLDEIQTHPHDAFACDGVLVQIPPRCDLLQGGRGALVQLQLEDVERIARFHDDIRASPASRRFGIHAQDALAQGADQVQGDLIVALRAQFLIGHAVQDPVEGGDCAAAVMVAQGMGHTLHEFPFGTGPAHHQAQIGEAQALLERGFDLPIGKIQPYLAVRVPNQRQKTHLVQQGVQGGTAPIERGLRAGGVEVDVS